MGWRMEHMAVATLSLRVPKVIGKQRPKFGKGRAYTPKQTELMEARIRDAFIARYGDRFEAFDGPLRVCIFATRELAASNPKFWAGMQDRKRPDLDNVAKLVLDALNGTAYADDAQVFALECVKQPRATHGTGSWLRIEIHYYDERYDGRR